MSVSLRTLCLSIVTLLVCATPSLAHTRSQSSSHWQVQGDTLQGRVQADALDVTRLYVLGGEAALEETFRAHVAESFVVATSDGVCAAGEPKLAPAAPGRVAVTLSFDCPGGALRGGAVDLKSTLFLQVAATHLHFVSVTRADGAEA